MVRNWKTILWHAIWGLASIMWSQSNPDLHVDIVHLHTFLHVLGVLSVVFQFDIVQSNGRSTLFLSLTMVIATVLQDSSVRSDVQWWRTNNDALEYFWAIMLFTPIVPYIDAPDHKDHSQARPNGTHLEEVFLLRIVFGALSMPAIVFCGEVYLHQDINVLYGFLAWVFPPVVFAVVFCHEAVMRLNMRTVSVNGEEMSADNLEEAMTIANAQEHEVEHYNEPVPFWAFYWRMLPSNKDNHSKIRRYSFWFFMTIWSMEMVLFFEQPSPGFGLFTDWQVPWMMALLNFVIFFAAVKSFNYRTRLSLTQKFCVVFTIAVFCVLVVKPRWFMQYMDELDMAKFWLSLTNYIQNVDVRILVRTKAFEWKFFYANRIPSEETCEVCSNGDSFMQMLMNWGGFQYFINCLTNMQCIRTRIESLCKYVFKIMTAEDMQKRISTAQYVLGILSVLVQRMQHVQQVPLIRNLQ